MSGDPAGVSLNATVGVTNPGNGGAQFPRVAKMTAVDELGRVDELTDGTGGSVDAVMGPAIGPYWKSRLMNKTPNPCAPANRRHVSALDAGQQCARAFYA